MEEMIDIYTASRERTGRTIPREGAFLREGEFMLYVLAIVQDARGRFLITQRSQDKHWAAGWWEVTGGGVRAGETSHQALVRELAEEVGLDVSGRAELLPAPIYQYENVDLARGDNYIVDIYLLKLDVTETDVALTDGEAVDFRFATWDDICDLADQGIFLHFKRLQQALRK